MKTAFFTAGTERIIQTNPCIENINTFEHMTDLNKKKDIKFNLIDYIWFWTDDWLFYSRYLPMGDLMVSYAIGTPLIGILGFIWYFVPLHMPGGLMLLLTALIYLAILVYSIWIYRKKGRGKKVKAHFLKSKYSGFLYETIAFIPFLFLPLYIALWILSVYN